MEKQIPKSIAQSAEVKRFVSAIRVEATKIEYLRVLRMFCEFTNAKKTRDLLGTNTAIEKRIERWIDYMKSKKLQGATIKTRIDVLKLFYDMNRRTLAWKIMTKMVPQRRPIKDSGWSIQELQSMLANGNPGIREIAVITLLTSTGMRKGTLPALNIGDFRPRDEWGIFQITCYRGDAEEYITYCTPEARKRLEEYWSFRKRHGEDITPQSPAFRQEWDLETGKNAAKPIRITNDTMDTTLRRVVIDAGLRNPKKTSSSLNAGQIRHAQKLLHGMRKFHYSTIRDAGYDREWAHKLQGHKFPGLDENYYRTPDDSLLIGTASPDGRFRKPGFVDVMQALVISDEERAKIKVRELQKVVQGEAKMQKQLDEQGKMLSDMAMALYEKDPTYFDPPKTNVRKPDDDFLNE